MGGGGGSLRCAGKHLKFLLTGVSLSNEGPAVVVALGEGHPPPDASTPELPSQSEHI